MEISGELRGGYEADACPGCHVGKRVWEACQIPACPAYGERGERARELAAAYRRWPSVAQNRVMSGTDALAALDRMAWLEYMRATGELIDIEIEHRSL